jgi:hypothetical protein
VPSGVIAAGATPVVQAWSPRIGLMIQRCFSGGGEAPVPVKGTPGAETLKPPVPEPHAPGAGATEPRPGLVNGNPANRLMETGTPLKNGQGWVKRWTTATAEDVASQNQAIFERYQQRLEESKNMTSDVAHTYRFEQMRQFRTQYRQQFLENRAH